MSHSTSLPGKKNYSVVANEISNILNFPFHFLCNTLFLPYQVIFPQWGCPGMGGGSKKGSHRLVNCFTPRSLLQGAGLVRAINCWGVLEGVAPDSKTLQILWSRGASQPLRTVSVHWTVINSLCRNLRAPTTWITKVILQFGQSCQFVWDLFKHIHRERPDRHTHSPTLYILNRVGTPPPWREVLTAMLSDKTSPVEAQHTHLSTPDTELMTDQSKDTTWGVNEFYWDYLTGVWVSYLQGQKWPKDACITKAHSEWVTTHEIWEPGAHWPACKQLNMLVSVPSKWRRCSNPLPGSSACFCCFLSASLVRIFFAAFLVWVWLSAVWD